MTIDETEINKLRFEDLSESLQELINNLVYYDELDYINLRIHVNQASDTVNTSVSVHAGDKYPAVISLGKTVYFDTANNNVKVADSEGNWVYTQ